MDQGTRIERQRGPACAGRLLALAIILILAGCGPGEPAATAIVDAGPKGDWTQTDEAEVYDSETIFNLVDGQADAFFAYGFEQVTVERYENGAGTAVDVEIWQLATAADAYGLFTTSVAGTPVDVGNGGDGDPGRRLAFWQERYFVQVRARQPIDETELRGFAEEVSARLPAGGRRPSLMDRLPTAGRVERSHRFFRQAISIQDVLWLGGENLLGLGPETDGALAQYELGGATARLLLISYASPQEAADGLAALEGGQVSGLVLGETQDALLGAVFGEVDETTAGELLDQALSGE